MNAGYWIKFLPAASVYKCEPAEQRESKLGPASGQFGARLAG